MNDFEQEIHFNSNVVQIRGLPSCTWQPASQVCSFGASSHSQNRASCRNLLPCCLCKRTKFRVQHTVPMVSDVPRRWRTLPGRNCNHRDGIGRYYSVDTFLPHRFDSLYWGGDEIFCPCFAASESVPEALLVLLFVHCYGPLIFASFQGFVFWDGRSFRWNFSIYAYLRTTDWVGVARARGKLHREMNKY